MFARKGEGSDDQAAAAVGEVETQIRCYFALSKAGDAGGNSSVELLDPEHWK